MCRQLVLFTGPTGYHRSPAQTECVETKKRVEAIEGFTKKSWMGTESLGKLLRDERTTLNNSVTQIIEEERSNSTIFDDKRTTF